MDGNALDLLQKLYPNADALKTEIINLNAILHLPKSTEFFFSDIHGEYESFRHLLKSASGLIQNKIELFFERKDQEFLGQIIYGDKLTLQNFPMLLDKKIQTEVLGQLLILCKEFSNQYTRSKVRKMLPQEFSYILEELLHIEDFKDRNHYYTAIIDSVIDNDLGFAFIKALRDLIPRLAVDQLHILGDIYDRGARPDKVMDILMKYQSVDIEWGNHDISWMGAFCGNTALIANVIRISLRYNHFDLLEYAYGINLRPLCLFAKETYGHDPCTSFLPVQFDQNQYDDVDVKITAMMHKAITVIQMKLEGQLIQKHPEYKLNHRNMLTAIDYQNFTISIGGLSYTLNSNCFPTIDPLNPLELTSQEKELIQSFLFSFQHSHRLKKHIKYLYTHGSLYKIMNNNLLYHGCIPFQEDGSLTQIDFLNNLKGKALFDFIESKIRNAYYQKEILDIDLMWYLWTHPSSPLFGKDKLAYFENYFLNDKAIRHETLNPYYYFIHDEDKVIMILKEFGLDENAHIINGHVPIRENIGQHPIIANKRLFMIDGGISKTYQQKTGIAGYTLIYDHTSLILATHQIQSSNISICQIENHESYKIKDSDKGKAIQSTISLLKQLLLVYQEGNHEKSSHST